MIEWLGMDEYTKLEMRARRVKPLSEAIIEVMQLLNAL